MKLFLSTILMILLGGCKAQSPYSPPSITVQESWKEHSEPAAQAIFEKDQKNWWEVFDDPKLNALQACALKNSPTIKAAFYRVSEAWSAVKIESANLYPHVALAPNGLNEIEFTRIYSADDYPEGTSNRNKRIRISQYNLPLITSYDFDLWGKMRYAKESAFASAEAQDEALTAAQLTLTASIAQTYFTVRACDAEIQILEHFIRLYQDACEVNRSRHRAELAGYADFSRAATELWLAKAELSERFLFRAKQEHLLAILIGEMPACFTQERHPLVGAPPYIPPCLPSELLLQRADLRQAERELASLYAQKGVAYASLFPSLSLSTEIGFSSSLLSELLDWKARFFALAWEGVQTVFDAGQRRAGVEAAKARFSGSLYQYRDRVLTAFLEVEDALASLKWQNLSLEALHAATSEAELTSRLTEEKFDRGLVAYLEVIDSKRTLLETQLNAIRVLGSQYISTVELIKAAGGSF